MRSSVRFVAALALLALALVESAYGLWFGPSVGAMIALDPIRIGWLGPVVGGAVGAVILALAIGVALVTAASAVGVAVGHRAGWWMAMGASGAWLLTGCAPIALLAVGILMLPEVRAIAFPP